MGVAVRATDRLYYHDSYLREFDAQVIGTNGNRVYLDRTAFYPASGGQPCDTGTIGGVPVSEVVDEEDRIAHITAAPVPPGPVTCRIDWERRFDHMQQHTGQHLLSAVMIEVHGAHTVSFHLGAEISTIEMEASLNPDQLREAELRANQVLFENRPVSVSFHEPGEEAGLRRAIERPGVLRVVSIDSLDRCACGGTHVRSTGEIGAILLGKTEKIRGNLRVEFLCGMRAVRRAREDLDALSKIARVLSCGVDESPALVANQLERLQESEKAHRRAVLELAEAHGREAWARATPAASGARRGFKAVESGPITDELRAFAQSFTTGSRSVFIVTTNRPPSILLAVSADFGRNAGALLKTALTAVNGRGGGGATLAQGSVATSELLAQVVAAIESALGD